MLRADGNPTPAHAEGRVRQVEGRDEGETETCVLRVSDCVSGYVLLGTHFAAELPQLCTLIFKNELERKHMQVAFLVGTKSI